MCLGLQPLLEIVTVIDLSLLTEFKKKSYKSAWLQLFTKSSQQLIAVDFKLQHIWLVSATTSSPAGLDVNAPVSHWCGQELIPGSGRCEGIHYTVSRLDRWVFYRFSPQ